MISAAIRKASLQSSSRRNVARLVSERTCNLHHATATSKLPRASSTSHLTTVRYFSSPETFKPKAPDELTTDMAEGIVESTRFYCRYGISNQRFHILATEDLSIQDRWSKMMEIYLQTQAHVIAGLGYPPNDEGLQTYAHHLHACINKTDMTMRELFMDIRRETWREIVATTFQIDPGEIPSLNIEEARNLTHKISSKMIEPDTLLVIQHKTAKIQNEDKQREIADKHAVMQEILVHYVYLGGSPSLVEEGGFGSGAAGYAKLQCALTDHEGDPLMTEYSASAMVKLLDAAGIDFNELMGQLDAKTAATATPVPGTGVTR